MAPRPLTLDDLHHELQRGRVYEASIRDPRWHLDGLRQGESVYIDPRPAILETLLHELLHRLRPQWGERRVLQESRRLLASMSDAEKARWWRAYQRVKRRSRPVEAE